MITLDKEMFITLREMWKSGQSEDKALFKGILINNLDHNDLLTQYYSHLLVCLVYHNPDYGNIVKMKTLEYELKLKLAGLEDCIIK